MSMATRGGQLAIVMVLMVPMVLGGAPPQLSSQTQSPPAGGLAGMQVGRVPLVASASLLATNPVAEFQSLMSQLNLTPDQQTRIKALAAARQAALMAAEKALDDASAAFRQAADAGNETTIRAGAGSIGSCLGNLQVLRVKTGAEMRAVLTPEQAARFSQLKAQAQARAKQQELATVRRQMHDQAQQITIDMQKPLSRPSQPKP